MKVNLAFLTLSILMSRCAFAGEILALKDDFSDGDITANPTWEAGDLHWFNPFFVEKIGDRYWAGSRRYGSFGTFFTDPETGWPVPLDVRKGPITVSLLVLFRPSTHQDALSMQLLGTDSRIAVRYDPRGSLLVRLWSLSVTKRRVEQTAYFKPAQSGRPVRMRLVIGGASRLVCDIDDKAVFRLDKSLYERVTPLLTQFDRIAFMGALRVTEPNVYMLVPQLQTTKAYRWITDIEVRGHPAADDVDRQPPLQAEPRTVLVFRGFASIRVPVETSLRAAGWSVTQVFDGHPLRGAALRVFRERLEIGNLRRRRWVVLFDVHARRLGLAGCAALREYVRCGGSILILGGPSTLGRGDYFSSPLAVCLPVEGPSTPSSLERVEGLDAAKFVHDVSPRPGATNHGTPVPFWQIEFGRGLCRVVQWATVGNPPRPFWKRPDCLPYLLMSR